MSNGEREDPRADGTTTNVAFVGKLELSPPLLRDLTYWK